MCCRGKSVIHAWHWSCIMFTASFITRVFTAPIHPSGVHTRRTSEDDSADIKVASYHCKTMHEIYCVRDSAMYRNIMRIIKRSFGPVFLLSSLLLIRINKTKDGDDLLYDDVKVAPDKWVTHQHRKIII